jgi:hypothetical protein
VDGGDDERRGRPVVLITGDALRVEGAEWNGGVGSVCDRCGAAESLLGDRGVGGKMDWLDSGSSMGITFPSGGLCSCETT